MHKLLLKILAFTSYAIPTLAQAGVVDCMELYYIERNGIHERNVPHAAFCLTKKTPVFMWFSYKSRKPLWCARATDWEKETKMYSEAMRKRTGRSSFTQQIFKFKSSSPVLELKLPVPMRDAAYVQTKEVDKPFRFKNFNGERLNENDIMKLGLLQAFRSEACRSFIMSYN